jgi:hypothetical protein
VRIVQGSLVRAVLFGLAWALLPYWLFVIAACALFFIPFSQSGKMLGPFLVLVALGAFVPVGAAMAAVFGLLFWYILLIKGLYVIDRRTAYEILMLALIFLVVRVFYSALGTGFDGPAPLFFAFVAAAASSWLFASFIGNFAEADPVPATIATAREATDGASRGNLLRRIAAFAAFFIMFEIILAGLFLPLNASYQSAVAFLLIAVVMDLAGRHLLAASASGSGSGTHDIDRARVLTVAGTAFILLVIIFGSARWNL